MQIYKIKAGESDKIRRRLILRTLPLMVFAFATGIFISSFNQESGNVPWYLPWVIIVPIGILAGGVGVYVGIKRRKALLESYTLMIDEDGTVTREQMNTPIIRITKNEIASIAKFPNGTLVVYGGKKSSMIGIPAQIERYPELENALGLLLPITEKSTLPFMERMKWPMVIFTSGLMVTLYLSKDKMAVLISGSLLAAIMFWTFAETFRTRNIDSKTKLNMYMTLPVMVFVAMQIYSKLMAQ